MGYVVTVVMLLTALLLTTPIIIPREKTSLAKEYALHQLVEYYKVHKTFPDTFSIPFYPYLSYSHGGAPTDARGTHGAYAVVRLAGKDRRLNTGDDVILTLTAEELEKDRYRLTERRARILEQALYSLCQRRKSVTGSVYYPPTIDDLVEEAQLPDNWKYTPFGAKFLYDTSSCSSITCYCTQKVVRVP